jgi:hypothetical protein
MPTLENVSYFSRFFLKFVEIITAGLATAVSGYLIAHLSGVLSSPGPAPAAAVTVASPAHLLRRLRWRLRRRAAANVSWD